jgi:hypothetical protein
MPENRRAVSVTAEMYRRLEYAADRRMRSTGNMVVWVLENWLDRQGLKRDMPEADMVEWSKQPRKRRVSNG